MESIIFVHSHSPLMPEAFRLRYDVFVIEQAVPSDLEIDELDAEATHVLAVENGRVIGTMRLVLHGHSTKIGRVAVEKERRGAGIGTRLMEAGLRHAVESGCTHIELDAQLTVVDFYKRLGFSPIGEPFDDAGIPHVKMTKDVVVSSPGRGDLV